MSNACLTGLAMVCWLRIGELLCSNFSLLSLKVVLDKWPLELWVKCLYLVICTRSLFLFSFTVIYEIYLNLLFLAGFPVILSVLKEERDDFEMVQLLCCQF